MKKGTGKRARELAQGSWQFHSRSDLTLSLVAGGGNYDSGKRKGVGRQEKKMKRVTERKRKNKHPLHHRATAGGVQPCFTFTRSTRIGEMKNKGKGPTQRSSGNPQRDYAARGGGEPTSVTVQWRGWAKRRASKREGGRTGDGWGISQHTEVRLVYLLKISPRGADPTTSIKGNRTLYKGGITGQGRQGVIL